MQLPSLTAAAEGDAPFPYALYASAQAEEAITINAQGTWINGSIASDGGILAGENLTVNGEKAENLKTGTFFCGTKLDAAYFSDCTAYEESMMFSEQNLNVTAPAVISGEASFEGNVSLNSAVKALTDITFNADSLNANNAVLYAKYGDISISGSNISYTGLIYAPMGHVEITANNLNLNNVVIIADTVTLNAPYININYNRNAAAVIGSESEPFDCPSSEWCYMADENEDGIPDFFESVENYGKLLDSDGDNLPNCFEEHFGTDMFNYDTDGDGLSDCVEVICKKSSPLETDSDQNGVADGDEDFDGDGLTNLYEISIGTGIIYADTDNDTLSDGEEIHNFGTDPLLYDTDGDTLSDGEELTRGTSPLLPDTDGNGIPDNLETIAQSYTYTSEAEDAMVKSVTVSMDTAGSLADNTAIRSILNEDIVCTDVAGLIGEPFSITTNCEFQSATISFEMSEAAIAETPLENMLVLWYDEANGKFVEMETTYNAAKHTVSIVTPHFSKYMVVDRYSWFNAWSMTFNYNPGREHQGSNYTNYQKNDTVLAIDCSGSMKTNDQVKTKTDINSAYDAQFTKTCGRIKAGENFVSQMMGDDRTGIVLFEDEVSFELPLTSDQLTVKLALQKVYDGGSTEFLPAIKSALGMFSEADLNDSKDNKRIVLLSDGGDFHKANTKSYLSNLYNSHNPDPRNRVKIFTVALGTGADQAFLKEIAEMTGGVPYTAKTAAELVKIYSEIGLDDFDRTDTDGDGLFDAVESAGIRLKNGKIVYTDPTKKDTDGDGIEDGVEINPEIRKARAGDDIEGYYFAHTSYPDKKNSDGDLYDDGNDSQPLVNYSLFDMVVSDGPGYSAAVSQRFSDGPVPPAFYTEHWDISEDEFASEERDSIGDVVMDVIWEELALFGSLYAYIPVANATTTAWSMLAGNWKDGDKIAYGSAPNAAAMLDWFLFGFGAEFYLTPDMFANLILSQEHNVEHYMKNLDACITEAEGFVNASNKNGMLECKPDARFDDRQANKGMYVSCFANRGQNCPYGHGQVSLASKYACDWNIAVGESFGTMQADVHYLGNDLYSMDYTYYLYDVYEWPDIQGLRDLHLHGVAHQYQIKGEIKGNIMWTKGQRVYNGALAGSAMLELNNNLSNVKEFFREMDINSDNMREVLHFYGLM